MNFLIPMAGKGTRTSKLGPFKPFIEVTDNKKIIDFCLKGISHLCTEDTTIIFVSTTKQIVEHDISYIIHESCKNNVPQALSVVVAINNTSGQLETIQKALRSDFISLTDSLLEEQFVIINSDQFNYFFIPDEDFDVALGTYFNNTGKSAYFILDKEFKNIIDIKEKQLISTNAFSGVAIFKSLRFLKEYINKYTLSDYTDIVNKEVYLSAFIKKLIDEKMKVIPITSKCKIDLGNEKEVLYIRNNPNIF